MILWLAPVEVVEDLVGGRASDRRAVVDDQSEAALGAMLRSRAAARAGNWAPVAKNAMPGTRPYSSSTKMAP